MDATALGLPSDHLSIPVQRELLRDLDAWCARGEAVALATLVSARGSTPRPAGARLGLTVGGGLSGSLTDGCVESDVIRRGRAVLDGEPAEVVRYGFEDPQSVLGVGLACGGSVEVLIERYQPDAVCEAVRRCVAAGTPAALAVGLHPQSLRARRLAATASGRLCGAIDPVLDDALADAARDLLDGAGGTTVVSLPFATDGGRARVFLEAYLPPPRLVVVGAAQTAVALSTIAKLVGFHVTIVDARAVFAAAGRFPDADDVVVGWPGEVLERIGLDGRSFVVVLGHDPKFELPALELALRSPAPYVGVIGSRGTHRRRCRMLAERGYAETELARIRAPIGLDIGARTPPQIAVAIVAEMLAVRHGRAGRPLVEGAGRIHGRSVPAVEDETP